jgi:hypothetical protein
VAFEPLRMTPAGTTTVRGGWTSWFAVFHPRFRGSAAAAFRAWVRDATLDARLGRYVDGRSLPGATPWPEPASTLVTPRGSGRLGAPREHIVVAFAEGESDSAELARAVRDVMRPAVRGEARILAVPGLDVGAATQASDPPWDVALVRWDWASLTYAQGAHELAWVLGLAGPGANEVLSRATDRWANGVVMRTDALAFVHAERPASLHASIHGVAPSGPLPYLVEAWSSN